MSQTTTLKTRSGFGQELDAITLERARRGDMDACAAIYRRFGTACFNLALRILGDRAAAEDVVQEVFLKMINTLPGFRGDAPFGVWLKRMTANATIDTLRAGQRFADEDPEALFASMASRNVDADLRVDAFTLLMRLPPRAARRARAARARRVYAQGAFGIVRAERELLEIDSRPRAEETRRCGRTRKKSGGLAAIASNA